MINLKKLQRDLDELPEEAQELLIDFVELLKKRYCSSHQQEISENNIDNSSYFICCVEAETDLSRNYKSYLAKQMIK